MKEEVYDRTLAELKRRGITYKGVLYAGLMIDHGQPSVVEFNCRFGDPETQAVLPMIKSDLAALFLAAARGEELPPVEVNEGASACVILASGGYPGDYAKGYEITGYKNLDSLIFRFPYS